MGQIEKAVQPLDRPAGLRVEEPLKGREITGPFHPPELTELRRSEPLNHPKSASDLWICVVDHLNRRGRLLKELYARSWRS